MSCPSSSFKTTHNRKVCLKTRKFHESNGRQREIELEILRGQNMGLAFSGRWRTQQPAWAPAWQGELTLIFHFLCFVKSTKAAPRVGWRGAGGCAASSQLRRQWSGERAAATSRFQTWGATWISHVLLEYISFQRQRWISANFVSCRWWEWWSKSVTGNDVEVLALVNKACA